MGRTTIITGAYGSGKTEGALALAMKWAVEERVTLIDLDFVNPYFRSQDHRASLEVAGVEVIAPPSEVAAIDAPALPPSAREVIVCPSGHTLVDLGGDPAGAIVIGQYAPFMTDYDMWAVVNFARPTTPDPDHAVDLLREIEGATRLRITGLISNTYLGDFTTAHDVVHGLELAQQLAASMHVPVVMACAPESVEVPPLGVPLLPISRKLLRPWE